MAIHRNRRLVLLGVAVVFSISFVAWIHGFLALNRPIRAGVLAVEGWLPPSALDEVPFVVASGKYMYVVFVQYPNEPSLDEEHLSNGSSFRQELQKHSIRITTVRVPSGSNRRTYAAALALKHWLTMDKIGVRSVDVFTVGVHARKSHFLYRHSLDKNISVGVIAAAPVDYDPKLWFISPRGVWLVMRNVAGYAHSVAWVYTEYLFQRQREELGSYSPWLP